MINAMLYQMLGSYYSAKAKKIDIDQKDSKEKIAQNVITLYEHAMEIVVKFTGDQTESIADVYLSRAVAFLNMGHL